MNDWGKSFPINNRQAEVAMDWLMSQATRPDATAARHTDARSLAVPVPRSTMIPTRLLCDDPSRRSRSWSDGRAFLIALHHRHTTFGKVYALLQRVRIFFQKNWRHARRVPIVRRFQPVGTASHKTRPSKASSRFRNRDQRRVH
jgi:hypothetical protein